MEVEGDDWIGLWNYVTNICSKWKLTRVWSAYEVPTFLGGLSRRRKLAHRRQTQPPPSKWPFYIYFFRFFFLLGVGIAENYGSISLTRFMSEQGKNTEMVSRIFKRKNTWKLKNTENASSLTGFNDGGGVVWSEHETERRAAAAVLSSTGFMKKKMKTAKSVVAASVVVVGGKKKK
jgi:hypothetical protein